MQSILQRHPLREQLDDMGDRIITSTPALAEAREHLDEMFRRNISPGGQWASLWDLSAQAAANASSDEKLYPPPELDGRASPEVPAARKQNSPRAFFGKHAVTVRSIDEFLHVVATIQSNYSGRRLVWRGQQNAAWPVQSSLHRHIVEVERGDGSEEHLVSYEQRAFAVASQWGIPTTPAMSFPSLLQHNGAPTRLLDVSVDPNVASWFAVEYEPKLESKSAHIVVWATRTRTRTSRREMRRRSGMSGNQRTFAENLTGERERQCGPGSRRRPGTTACGRNARVSSSEHPASSRRLSRTCTPSTSVSTETPPRSPTRRHSSAFPYPTTDARRSTPRSPRIFAATFRSSPFTSPRASSRSSAITWSRRQGSQRRRSTRT